MDNLNISPDTASALQNLSAKDKAELNQFVMQETQKAQIQQTVRPLLPLPFPLSHPFADAVQQVHSLTDMCFRKCITAKISAGKLDRSEEPCVMNCVDRYMDANMTVIKHLEQMRQLG